MHLKPHADVERVRSELQSVITKAEVLTAAEFSSRSRSFWLFGTGAGAALFAGALLAMVVGSVVVAQTLYASTKEHLYEFATLRAIGSSGTYLHTVIVAQALLSAVAGFAIAFLIGLFVVRVTSDSALPVLMTPAPGGTAATASVLATTTTGMASCMASMSDSPSEVHRIGCR